MQNYQLKFFNSKVRLCVEIYKKVLIGVFSYLMSGIVFFVGVFVGCVLCVLCVVLEYL